MKKQLKCFLAAGCLFALLFLTACGGSSGEGNPPAVSGKPEETPAASLTEPSAAPDSAAAQEAVTAADDGTQSAADPEQQSASGMFTGVAGTEFLVPEGLSSWMKARISGTSIRSGIRSMRSGSWSMRLHRAIFRKGRMKRTAALPQGIRM